MSFAFIFPGQGSQSVGMLSAFADEQVVRDTFAEASETLGYDLWQLCQEGPAQELNQTDRTQPALLTASVAVYRLWHARNGKAATLMAGHSLGEYSALVCAGALSLAEGVKLVKARGEFMQQAVPAGSGKMAAIIGLDDELIAAACKAAEAGEVVAPVNYNSPGQVVIAGEAAAVERAMDECKTRGAKRALPLPVSVPSHCALMKPAADQLKPLLKEVAWQTPNISVINNVDVASESDPTAICNALERQLYNPVRWTETIVSLQGQGVSHLVECGAGNVLSGLAKRIDRSLVSLPTTNLEQFESALISIADL